MGIADLLKAPHLGRVGLAASHLGEHLDLVAELPPLVVGQVELRTVEAASKGRRERERKREEEKARATGPDKAAIKNVSAIKTYDTGRHTC